jgi:uncharacterized repeat protein (TIGR02543 family)
VNVSPTDGGSVEVNGAASSSYPASYIWNTSTLVPVEAVPASGYDFAGWSEDLAGNTNPTSILVDCLKTITANFTPQAGPGPVGAIEGFVWEDADGNGIQDSNELGIDDMMVKLYDSNDNLVRSTATSDGSYRFDGLAPGEYYLFFDAPSYYLFTLMDQGENDDIDSDADATGRIDDITLSAEVDLTLDAGVFWNVDITAQEAKNMIDTNQDLIVADVREESEFCGEGGHIAGAVNYPWNSGVFEQNYTELPVDADILLVCGSGYRSGLAAEFLYSKGYTTVFNLAGGMNAWEWQTVGCNSGSGGGGDSGCFIATAANASCISHIFMLLFIIIGMAVIFRGRTLKRPLQNNPADKQQ